MACYCLTFENMEGQRRLRRVLFIIALWSLAQCTPSREAETRRRAHTLIEQLQRLDPKLPAAPRERALSTLSALSLDDAELRELRDTCVRAHRGLLDAQGHQRRAQEVLAVAADRQQDVPKVEDRSASPVMDGSSDLLQAARALSRSEQALTAARGDLRRCRELSGPVVRRFR